MNILIKFFIISLILILVLVIFLGVISLFNGWTTFDLSLLFNKIFDFSLGLLSFLVAFSVVSL